MRSNDSAKVMRSAVEAFVPSFEYCHSRHVVILSLKPYLPVQMQSREAWTVRATPDQVSLYIGYGNEFRFWKTAGQWYFESYHQQMPCSAPALEMLSQRLARLTNMHNDGQGNVRIEYHIPTRGLIGFRSAFLTATRGEGIMSTLFLEYEPWLGDTVSARNGMLVASELGTAVTYGLNNAQDRGITFIEPGTQVYEGMIIGENSRESDLDVNVTKEKKQTNMRASGTDEALMLIPPKLLNLEQAIEFIKEDELVEITPQSIRLRKRVLEANKRPRAKG